MPTIALSQKNIEQQIKSVVDATDHLSLSFCQLEIRLLFSIGHDTEHLPGTLSSAFLEAVKSSVQSDGAPCFDLVTGLEADLTTQVWLMLIQTLSHLSLYHADPYSCRA
jgi:mediator of RNA polymerase II transcription subunit 12